MTKADLEAENARLRAALMEAGIDPDGVADRQVRQRPQSFSNLSSSRPNNNEAALVSREARHRAVFESAVDFAIIVTDPRGDVTDWNPGAERILGWTAEEMQASDVERIFTPEDRARNCIQLEMQRALLDGRAGDDRWHLRKDGGRFWASGEMMPLLGGNGEHLGFVKILRDRTEEHLAGAALQKAQQRFETLLETIEAAFAIVEVKFDADERPIYYRFTEANPAFERQSGVNLRGKWVTEFAPNLEPFWFETYGHVAKTGEPTIFENYAEAFQRWFDVRAVRVGDPADRQIAILFNDVTTRREAEQRLRASEALARQNAERVQLALAAGAIIGTWHWDLPSDQFKVDEDCARAFGLEPALGRDGIPLAQIVANVHPDYQAGLAGAMNEAIARGGHYAHQYRVRRVDGNYYWIEANGRVDLGADGTPLNFPGVLIDVEARRSIEDERDRAIAALRFLNENLEQRVAERSAELMQAEEKLRQSQKMEAVGQLTGGLAHDFNNLLAGISGSLEMIEIRLRQGRLNDLWRYIEAARGASRRAAALTHRLLAFSRRQPLDPSPTAINSLIAGMEELILRTVGPAIEIEVVADAKLWMTLVDANQLENALLNLCINARDAMVEGGRIVIHTANVSLDEKAARERDLAPGQYVALSVADTGVGMTPDVVAHAFDPFFTTKPMGEGTGLGLSMIYGFVRQSGGQVRAYSKPGQGTTMRLYLPRHGGQGAQLSGSAESLEVPRAGQGETVLVIEDEPTVRMLVKEVMQDLGYNAIEATDGASGLEVLRSSTHIDLVDRCRPAGRHQRS